MAKERSYTSGPWHVFDGDVYAAEIRHAGEPRIARIDYDEPLTENDKRDANARLIAAAPTMAAALRSVMAYPWWKDAPGAVRERVYGALKKAGALDE